MEYQKIIKLFENTLNRPPKFRTVFKSGLCGHSDAYILIKRTMIIPNETENIVIDIEIPKEK